MAGLIRKLVVGLGNPRAERRSTRLVVGLGNPGLEYEDTRHNIGFRFVDRVAAQNRLPAFRRDGGGLETRGRLDGEGAEEVALLKPLTFMNRSGRLVARRLGDLELSPDQLLVCYDDLALPLGRLRLRPSGSSAGHNGVQSIIDVLGTDAFPRLRFGIQPAGRFGDQVEFVLSPFRKAELDAVDEALDRAARAVECFCREGIRAAMDRFNPAPAA